MMSNRNARSRLPQYIVCYLALLAMAALGILLMQAMILALTQVGLALGFNRYVMTAINQFGFVILGVLWLVGFLGLEAYLRHGVQTNRLLRRIGKVFAWQIGLFLIAFALQSIPA